MGVLNQTLCTFIISFLCMSSGVIFTWPSCVYTNFASVNSTLDRQMSAMELSLLGSLSSIGSLISTPIAGMLLDKFGRKHIAIFAALVQVIVWTLFAVSNQVEVVLVAIFLSGIGGCVFLVVPMFICEICQENIRGAMTSLAMIFYAVGMLLSYLMALLTYQTMVYVCITSSVVMVGLLLTLKETPTALMQKGLEKEATQAMAFYRNARVDSKLVQREMDTLRRAFIPALDEEMKTPEEQKLKGDDEGAQEKMAFWEFVKKSRSTRQAAIMIVVVVTTTIFQGLVVIQVFAQPLFEEAVPNMSSTLCSVVLALISIVVGLAAAYLTERAGRKLLLIYGSLGTGLCCLVLGTQLQLHWAPHWVTAFLIYLYCSCYVLGPGSVPFVLLAEIFLPEVKSVMSMLIVEWVWLCNFLILFIFGPIVAAIGLGPVFYIFAAICMITVVFCIKYVPETKGLPIDAVQLLFVKHKSDRR